MSNTIVTCAKALELRRAQQRLPTGMSFEYSNQEVEDIAYEQEELMNRIEELDNELKTMVLGSAHRCLENIPKDSLDFTCACGQRFKYIGGFWWHWEKEDIKKKKHID